jgi:hypothetical protein
MTQTFILLFTLSVMAMFCIGYWFGWLTDPEQWPRVMTALVLDLFRWDRQMSRQINDLDAWAEAMMAEARRAPHGTPGDQR